jgi:hypothetical protein
MKKKKLQACPHCGSTYGYYIRVRYTGIGHLFFDFDDIELETLMNSGFYNSSNWTEYKSKYCTRCYKKLGVVKDVKK